jgi:hypothetical protein
MARRGMASRLNDTTAPGEGAEGAAGASGGGERAGSDGLRLVMVARSVMISVHLLQCVTYVEREWKQRSDTLGP